MIDLHMHSYYSDGIYSPADLVKKTKRAGLNFISLTDHNAIDGVKEFLAEAKAAGVRAVPGVEIYTLYPAGSPIRGTAKPQFNRANQNRSLHLLGYGFDLADKSLNLTLKELQKQKIPRVKKAIKFLQADGWQLREEEVLSGPASYLGLVHLANALKKDSKNWQRIKKDFNWFPGKIITIIDIIVKYFIKDKRVTSLYNGESICPETTIPADRAIKLIKQAGGQAVLAHPGEQLSWQDDELIIELKKLGLSGLEAVSAHHSWSAMEHWQKVAKENGLIITCGSDFHGDLPEEWGFPIRSQWEYFIPHPEKMHF